MNQTDSLQCMCFCSHTSAPVHRWKGRSKGSGRSGFGRTTFCLGTQFSKLQLNNLHLLQDLGGLTHNQTLQHTFTHVHDCISTPTRRLNYSFDLVDPTIGQAWPSRRHFCDIITSLCVATCVCNTSIAQVLVINPLTHHLYI